MPAALKRISTCDNCKFFSPISDADNWGFCHRLPPFTTNIPIKADANGNPITIPTSSFAPVQKDAWCGEHKPKLLDA